MQNFLILYTLHAPDIFRAELEDHLVSIGAVRFVGHETAWLLRSWATGQEIADMLRQYLFMDDDKISVVPMHPSVEIYTSSQSNAFRDARFLDLIAAGHLPTDAWAEASYEATILGAPTR